MVSKTKQKTMKSLATDLLKAQMPTERLNKLWAENNDMSNLPEAQTPSLLERLKEGWGETKLDQDGLTLINIDVAMHHDKENSRLILKPTITSEIGINLPGDVMESITVKLWDTLKALKG